MKIRETGALPLPHPHPLFHQEQRRHMISDTHTGSLVCGDLTWGPQTNAMIYATNEGTEKWCNNHSTRPSLHPICWWWGHTSCIFKLNSHWPSARVELSLQVAFLIMAQWRGTLTGTQGVSLLHFTARALRAQLWLAGHLRYPITLNAFSPNSPILLILFCNGY